MSEPLPQYRTTGAGHDANTMPPRALNLARRVLDLERQCAGRGRLELQVIMIDGEWLLLVSKPGAVERLGE